MVLLLPALSHFEVVGERLVLRLTSTPPGREHRLLARGIRDVLKPGGELFFPSPAGRSR